MSLRSWRLCESQFLIPIFAFSAPLRESTPHPHLCVLNAFSRVNSHPYFAFSAPLRESIPHPYLCVLSAFARVHSSSLLCVLSAFARVHSHPYLCVLGAFARVNSQSLSLRPRRLCESPLLIPIFAFSAPLRESILIPIFAFSAPLRESILNPYLCVLGAFARVHSSSLSLRSRRLCESPLLIPIFASSTPLRESTPHPHLCVLNAFARVHSQFVLTRLRLPQPVPFHATCPLFVLPASNAQIGLRTEQEASKKLHTI